MPARRRLDRSVDHRAGWRSISSHWVGTPWATVTRSTSISLSASEAVQGAGVITVVMTFAISSHARVMVPT